VYPTKSDTPPSNALSSTGDNNANFHGPGSSVTIGSPYYRTEVGAFANSVSLYGTYDQGGNAAEWTETTDRWYPANGKDLLGGSFYDDVTYLAFSGQSVHGTGRASTATYETGFRVASVPEPGSIVLFVAGGLCLLGYAWRRRWA
jgi:formylglycine-generating enzyme